ncbi:MAG: helix-turn-helix transcriptional regulator [Pseudomonadota bacterium]
MRVDLSAQGVPNAQIGISAHTPPHALQDRLRRLAKVKEVVPFGILFGRLVREKRGIEGLSLDNLVAETGVSKPSLSNLENGKIRNPRAKTVDALCVALNISREERNACHPATEAPRLPPRLLESLAYQFGHTSPDASEEEQEQFLRDKATDYRRLTEELAALREAYPNLGNQIVEAEGLLSEGKLDEAESILANIKDLSKDRAYEAAKEISRITAMEGAIALLRDDPDEACAHFLRAADFLTPFSVEESAELRQRRGQQLGNYGRQYGATASARAVDVFSSVLEIAPKERFPAIWANAQRSSGIDLMEQGKRHDGEEGLAFLAQAVAAHRAALEVYTREVHPVEWSRTQHNLSLALRHYGSRQEGEDGTVLLSEALTACRAALEMRTREAEPVLWASSQIALGLALRYQGCRQQGEASIALLAESVIVTRAALKVYTRMAKPVLWAMTQNNLGNSLSEQACRQASEDGVALLGEAMVAYGAALEVRTREARPVDWAMTQGNLALAYRAWAELDPDHAGAHLSTALRHVEASLEVFEPEHMPLNFQTATRLRDQIKAHLDALG